MLEGDLQCKFNLHCKSAQSITAVSTGKPAL